MMSRGIYPGTFDPVTNGHLDLIERGSRIFSHLIVAVARNPEKQPLFTPQERQAMLHAEIKRLKNVSVEVFDGLVVDFARKCKAHFILRGVRSVADYEYELQMAIANRSISNEQVDTLFLLPSLKNSFLSSRLVKQAAAFGGDVTAFVPKKVYKQLVARLAQRRDGRKSR